MNNNLNLIISLINQRKRYIFTTFRLFFLRNIAIYVALYKNNNIMLIGRDKEKQILQSSLT